MQNYMSVITHRIDIIMIIKMYIINTSLVNPAMFTLSSAINRQLATIVDWFTISFQMSVRLICELSTTRALRHTCCIVIYLYKGSSLYYIVGISCL